jgi:hypothetical protein
VSTWSEHWKSQAERVLEVESTLRRERATTVRGGDFDDWDLEIRGGLLGGARITFVVEEHGAGRQMTRVRIRPWYSLGAVMLQALLVIMGLFSVFEGEWVAAALLATGTAVVFGRQVYECGGAVALAERAARREGSE